jgi:hypothetical protein
MLQTPLQMEIEELSSKLIGDQNYHGKPIVLLEDAISSLENLENRLWTSCQEEVNRARAGMVNNY